MLKQACTELLYVYESNLSTNFSSINTLSLNNMIYTKLSDGVEIPILINPSIYIYNDKNKELLVSGLNGRMQEIFLLLQHKDRQEQVL